MVWAQVLQHDSSAQCTRVSSPSSSDCLDPAYPFFEGWTIMTTGTIIGVTSKLYYLGKADS